MERQKTKKNNNKNKNKKPQSKRAGEILKIKELNEMKASQLPDTEFKTMVVRMLNRIRKRMDELSWNLNTEIASVKN